MGIPIHLQSRPLFNIITALIQDSSSFNKGEESPDTILTQSENMSTMETWIGVSLWLGPQKIHANFIGDCEKVV